MKLRTHRTNTTRPFEHLFVQKGITPPQTQFAIEQKVDFVVKRLNDVQCDARVEYIRQKAQIFGSNGQKVRISAV